MSIMKLLGIIRNYVFKEKRFEIATVGAGYTVGKSKHIHLIP